MPYALVFRSNDVTKIPFLDVLLACRIWSNTCGTAIEKPAEPSVWIEGGTNEAAESARQSSADLRGMGDGCEGGGASATRWYCGSCLIYTCVCTTGLPLMFVEASTLRGTAQAGREHYEMFMPGCIGAYHC